MPIQPGRCDSQAWLLSHPPRRFDSRTPAAFVQLFGRLTPPPPPASPKPKDRLRHLLRQQLDALDRLDPTRQHGPAYLAGILRQSRRLPPLSTLDGIPADHLRTALQILDTHLRRLRTRPVPLEPAPLLTSRCRHAKAPLHRPCKGASFYPPPPV